MARIGPIEKGVPIPPKGGGPTHPIASMQVGDSRLIEGVTQKQVGAKASDLGRALNRKYVTRQVTGGVRVWRTM